MSQEVGDLLGRSPLWASVDVIGRLVRRYNLEDIASESNALLLPRIVVPVTQVDDLLRTSKQQTTTKNLTAGAGGAQTYFTVPAGKRWNMSWYNRDASIGSSHTKINVDGATNQTAIDPTQVGQEYGPLIITLNEGGTIACRTTGDGADVAIRLSIWYEEEDAF